MPRFAANLSMMYTEHALAERYAAAAADGFTAVEWQFPYAVAREDLARARAAAGVRHVLINAPPGRAEAGERGISALPGREEEFRRSFAEQALPYAQALQCPRIHVMAGIVPPGIPHERCRATYLANLEWAARQAAAHAMQVLIEPLNARDAPGYFVSRQDDAHAIVAEVGATNLAVQMDLYHVQIVEGDVAMKLRRYLGAAPRGSRVGHIQVASIPDRHEPDEGELNYAYLFALIDELGWREPLGAEYRPRAATSAGLAWFQPFKESRT
jgi:hydroxypyruvate isomerase